MSHPHTRKAQLTLSDVALAAGVSEMTVSRVLRGRSDVSEATREKVVQAARAIGYVPNKIAGALASNRVNLVGVIVPSLSNMVFPEVLSGITAALEETPLQPVFGTSNYSVEQEEKVLFEMLSWRPSGVILAGLEHTDASRAMMAAAGIPVVEVMDVDGTPVDTAVGISHHRAGYDLAREAIARGYRNMGVIRSARVGDTRAHKRHDGFLQGLSEAGLSLVVDQTYAGGSGFQNGREMTARALAECPSVDFIAYSSDLTAAGGLLYAIEQGLDVGGAFGLAGFNGFELVSGLPKELATTESCRWQTGHIAAEIVAETYDLSSYADRRVELNPTFQPGQTMRAR